MNDNAVPLWVAALTWLAVGALIIALSWLVIGCTPAQMRPAADTIRHAAEVAHDVSDVSRLSGDAMELSAELGDTVAGCREQFELAPPPEPLGVHPCVWDVMADTKRAVEAIQELADALQALGKP